MKADRGWKSNLYGKKMLSSNEGTKVVQVLVKARQLSKTECMSQVRVDRLRVFGIITMVERGRD